MSERRDVVILGAGFSKAIYDSMPLIDELGNDCRMELTDSVLAQKHMPGIFRNGYFEIWLSRIAEDQPDYSDIRNAENHALFLEVSWAIRKIVDQRQRVAMAAETDQGWLFDFVEKLHNRRATVITLNYDNLIEFAVQSFEAVGRPALEGESPSGTTKITAEMLIDHLPLLGGAPTYGSLEHAMADTFSLHKLHGSLDWWWTPGDVSGATISRSPLVGGFGSLSDEREDEEDRKHRQPGRSPYIVPPTASKSSYFLNPQARELWARSAKALSEATALTIFGYSAPVTDVVMAEMIRESTNPDCPVTVVTLDEDGVRTRLRGLGISDERVANVFADAADGPAEFVNDF